MPGAPRRHAAHHGRRRAPAASTSRSTRTAPSSPSSSPDDGVYLGSTDRQVPLRRDRRGLRSAPRRRARLHARRPGRPRLQHGPTTSSPPASPARRTDGAAADIDVRLGGGPIYTNEDGDVVDNGDDNSKLRLLRLASARRQGRRLLLPGHGRHQSAWRVILYWYLKATDRAGNTTRTEIEDDDNRDKFRIFVDVSNPEFRDARTGISYDSRRPGGSRGPLLHRGHVRGGRRRVSTTVMNIDARQVPRRGWRDRRGRLHPAGSQDTASAMNDKDQQYPLDIDGNCRQ